MKKIILAASAVILMLSCTQTRQWTDKEREEVKTILRSHQEKSALSHMEKEAYLDLEGCVVTTIEGTYPDYNQFNQLTGQQDTIVEVLVSCTDDILGPNYENLAKLFPYAELAKAGILPADLTAEQQGMFYVCLTGKLQNTFPSPQVFADAMLHNVAAMNGLIVMMKECAVAVIPPTTDAAKPAVKK